MVPEQSWRHIMFPTHSAPNRESLFPIVTVYPLHRDHGFQILFSRRNSQGSLGKKKWLLSELE